jgi:autotransporter-associated beta strand protein
MGVFAQGGVTLLAADAFHRELPGWRRRRPKLLYLASVGALALMAASPALAQTPRGGSGGSGSSAFTNGGLSSATGAGDDGLAATIATRGGGGGGAGVTSGKGGSDSSGSALGGSGTDSDGNGYDGENGGSNTSGGGGAGGVHGAVVTTGTTNSGTVAGTRGGDGGSTTGTNRSGGGGGAGGYGVVVDGSGLTYTNAATGIIRAGNGGAGGANTLSDGYGGNGGDGGIGVFLSGGNVLNNAGSISGGNGGNGGNAPSSSGISAGGDGGNGGIGVYANGPATIINSGSITGGSSGNAGTANLGTAAGTVGDAGVGIVGADLTVINSGTIAGGLQTGGYGPVNAITFTGGSNVLEIQAGSSISGNVVGTGTDTFRLGGATDSTFDVSSIGPAAQYQGFSTFVKTGASTWTLTGTTTATTPWSINQGVLAVSSDASLGAASGGLSFDGGTLRFLAGFTMNRAITMNSGGGSFDTNGNDATLAGGIGGTGGLTKIGLGTLILSGTSSYTGETHVNAGTLQAGAVGAFSSASAFTVAGGATLDLAGFDQTIGSLAGAGSVTLGAATLTAGGDNSSTIFSGTISGSGGFTKAGNGIMQLSGMNSYTGATNVNAGTLRAVVAGTFSSASAFTVASGATLDLAGFNQTIGSLAGAGSVTLGAATLTAGGDDSSTIFSGTISGTGGFTKTGTGILQFSGTNSYTGATTISAGTLKAGATGAFASASAFTVATGATLDLGGFDQTIGSLAGAGSVTLGAATLTAGGDNSSTTFSGTISGSGGLTKAGSGTLRLTGTSTYTGATIVDGGTLDVEGTLASTSAVTVNAGGTLTGAGIVDPPLTITINAGGTLAPGNGTPGSSMTIDGNLVMQSGATYRVQVDPSTASFATVNGTASLGGATVNAVFASGGYVSKTYTILTASGGISGTFATGVVSTNLPFGFKTSLSYDANDAYLDLALSYAVPSGLNRNQQAVADALTDFFDRNGGIPAVYGALTPAGLTQAAGESGTAAQQATFDAMGRFVGLLTDPAPRGLAGTGSASGFADERSGRRTEAFARLADTPPASFEQRWNVWAAGLGGARSTSGNASTGSNEATSRSYAVAAGADRWLSPQTVTGFALAGGGTSFGVNGQGSGRSDLFQAGIHLRHTEGAAFIAAALAYGWQDVTTDRTVTISGADRLRANFKANAWAARLEGGTRFVLPVSGGFGLSPYAAVQATLLDQPAYAEQVVSGTSAFALSYASRRVTDTRSELGLRSDRSFALQDGILSFRGRLAWAHDFNPDRTAAATFQVLPGASFTTSGASQARDSALTTTSIEMNWTNGWSASASFESELSAVTHAYGGKGTLRYAW